MLLEVFYRKLEFSSIGYLFLYFRRAINETQAQAPSKIINGIYFNNIDARQAIHAPNKLRSKKERSLLFILPTTFKK